MRHASSILDTFELLNLVVVFTIVNVREAYEENNMRSYAIERHKYLVPIESFQVRLK